MRFGLRTLMIVVTAIALLGGWWRIDPVSAVWMWWFALIIGSVAVACRSTSDQGLHVLVGGVAGSLGVLLIGWLIRKEAMYSAMPVGYYAGHLERREFIRHFGNSFGWLFVCGWLGLFIGYIASITLARLTRK